MNKAKCIKCGKEDGLKAYSFLTVNVKSSSSTSGRVTTTTTTESFTGAASCAVCGDCIREKRINYAIGCGIGTLIGVLVAAILFGASFLGNNYYNNHFPGVVRFALAAGAVAAIIVFIVTLQKEAPFLAAMLKKAEDKKKNSSVASLVYVPMDPSLYVNKQTNSPELAVFTRKTGLKTALTATLFLIILAGGSDAREPEAPVEPAEPATPANASVSGDDLLNQSVQRLLDLYKQQPEGFLKIEAGDVRAVGEQLNTAGGMNLMLRAHQAFQSLNPRMARNLELVWDGIGSWRG